MTASPAVGTELGKEHLDVNAWYIALPLTTAMHTYLSVNHQCLKGGQSRHPQSYTPRHSHSQGLKPKTVGLGG